MGFALVLSGIRSVTGRYCRRQSLAGLVELDTAMWCLLQNVASCWAGLCIVAPGGTCIQLQVMTQRQRGVWPNSKSGYCHNVDVSWMWPCPVSCISKRIHRRARRKERSERVQKGPVCTGWVDHAHKRTKPLSGPPHLPRCRGGSVASKILLYLAGASVEEVSL